MNKYELIQTKYPFYTCKKAKLAKPKGIIFFIHGYAVNSDYHNFFADLVDDYDYYAIEHPGHGITPLHSKKQLSLWSFANEVVKLINDLDLTNVILIGHSMGGGISVLVSKMIAKRIKKMILVTPMNSHGTTNVFNFLFFMSPTKLSQLPRYYKILLGDISKMNDISDQEKHNLLKNMKTNSKNYRILRIRMASVKNILTLSKNEKNLLVKTLLIVGDKDGCINYKTTMKNFKRKNKTNLDICVFNNCGHLPFFEHQKKYFKTIMEYIDE